MSQEVFEISESDRRPARLVLKSTLPVTCPSGNMTSCTLSLSVLSMAGIVVRQRHPTLSTYTPCGYVFTEDDWKPAENLAYNDNAPLEITAKVVVMSVYIFAVICCCLVWHGGVMVKALDGWTHN